MRALLLFFFFLATVTAATHDDVKILLPGSGAGHRTEGELDCLSWRLAVETYNIQFRSVVPAACAEYVAHYMTGGQYGRDCDMAAYAAYQYAKNVTLAGDGKDIWVFDMDDTALSNLPYYAQPDNAFGAKEFNVTTYDEWLSLGINPAVPSTLKLYNKLKALGIKIVFISGKKEKFRTLTVKNLEDVGYTGWEKLVLKGANETGTAVLYKSTKRTELVEQGYRIVGNMGDQWSDITGQNVGDRTFKLPNPMFFIP